MRENVENFIDDLCNHYASGNDSRLISRLAIKNGLPLTEEQAERGYIQPSTAYHPTALSELKGN